MGEWQPMALLPRSIKESGETVLLARWMSEGWGWVIGYGHWEGDPDGIVAGWLSFGFSDPPGNLGLGHPDKWMRIPRPAPPTEGAE